MDEKCQAGLHLVCLVSCYISLRVATVQLLLSRMLLLCRKFSNNSNQYEATKGYVSIFYDVCVVPSTVPCHPRVIRNFQTLKETKLKHYSTKK